MKTNYKLIALFVGLLFPFLMQAQRQVFFTESFGEGAPNAAPYPTVTEWTGWHNPSVTFTSGGLDSVADLRSTYVSAAATMPYPEGSGSNNMYLSSDTETGVERGFDMNGIDASDFKNIQLTFGYRKSLAEVRSDLDVFYWNGTTWVKLDFQFVEETDPTGWYRIPAINLPADAQRNDLGFRFRRPSTSMNSIRIDDVWLTGEPVLSAVPVAKDATDVNSTSFTANWEAYTGATGYLLDVSENEDFTIATDSTVLTAFTFPQAYVKETVAAPNIYSSNNEDMSLTVTATGNTSDPIPYSAGSGTEVNPYALSSTGWEDGVYKKYFQIDVNTTGYYGLTLSSWIYSSGNGPKNMKVQYRLSTTGAWIDVPNSDLVMPEAAYGPTSKLSNLQLPSACDNQPLVLIRWIMNGSLRTSGKSAYIVTSGGTSRITNIYVKGMEGTVVSGYQSVAVTGTSQAVTGLDVNKTYYYRVRAIDGTYVTNASAVKQVTTSASGLSTLFNKDAVQIYYNAVTKSFEVNTTQDVTNALVKVTDLSGRTLSQTKLTGSKRSISASELSSGVYVVTLSYNGQTFNYKTVK